ncbi:hypothetical protein [Natranaeroarchaeum aerophilus]|uniref:DUF7975 domain-containing protein n=1 Tax=Natranaeroarchaeum aerophilus TaxID=2917711 RepID=A0AAE3FSI6_9EURY|nr:hypothetical protein [Natranaeroarchaeum aerophilus]MCL9814128.1 hypothetical protein [Natranaeroarchaeum aerophilus]
MTRFDAETAEERRALVEDAIVAHRERTSPFLTLEAELPESAGEDAVPPWIQLSEDTLNLDCTDAELDRLKSLLDEYRSFSVDELVRPEEAEGTNARVLARTDDERIAQFVEDVFRQVYDRGEDYRLWAAEV